MNLTDFDLRGGNKNPKFPLTLHLETVYGYRLLKIGKRLRTVFSKKTAFFCISGALYKHCLYGKVIIFFHCGALLRVFFPGLPSYSSAIPQRFRWLHPQYYCPVRLNKSELSFLRYALGRG